MAAIASTGGSGSRARTWGRQVRLLLGAFVALPAAVRLRLRAREPSAKAPAGNPRISREARSTSGPLVLLTTAAVG